MVHMVLLLWNVLTQKVIKTQFTPIAHCSNILCMQDCFPQLLPEPGQRRKVKDVYVVESGHTTTEGITCHELVIWDTEPPQEEDSLYMNVADTKVIFPYLILLIKTTLL